MPNVTVYFENEYLELDVCDGNKNQIAGEWYSLKWISIDQAPMSFYTMVLKRSSNYWVALCLENGIVGQGETQDQAIDKLKEAIDSFQSIYETEPNVHLSPVPIQELHEFLALETEEPTAGRYELRAVYA